MPLTFEETTRILKDAIIDRDGNATISPQNLNMVLMRGGHLQIVDGQGKKMVTTPEHIFTDQGMTEEKILAALAARTGSSAFTGAKKGEKFGEGVYRFNVAQLLQDVIAPQVKAGVAGYIKGSGAYGTDMNQDNIGVRVVNSSNNGYFLIIEPSGKQEHMEVLTGGWQVGKAISAASTGSEVKMITQKQSEAARIDFCSPADILRTVEVGLRKLGADRAGANTAVKG